MNYEFTRKSLLIAIVALVIVIAGVFYYLFDPMQSSFMPQCVFHKLTGLRCMGCGTQRVIHSLLHGDFSGALKANTLVTLSFPFLFFLLWLELFSKRHNSLYSRIHSSAFIWSVAALLILWFLLRNLLDL